MDACNKAVADSPENVHPRDSRGMARVLTGNYDGAIKDFESYIKEGKGEQDKGLLDQRRLWIKRLKKGLKPFDRKNPKFLMSQ
jgi:hypothetical protein